MTAPSEKKVRGENSTRSTDENCLTWEKFESGSAGNMEKHAQVDWETGVVTEYKVLCRIQQ